MIYTITLNPSIDYHMHVKHFKTKGTNRSDEEYLRIGGKGINVSLMLNNLGEDTTCLGFVGGFTGQYFESVLSQYPFVHHQMIQIEEDTRINIKMTGQEDFEVNAIGPFVSDEKIQRLMYFVQSLTEDDLVVISGKLAKGMKESWYQEVCQILKQQKISFVIDIANQTLLELLPYHPYLVKPNKEELGIIFNTEINDEAGIIHYGQLLFNQGAQNVIVSLGPDGAICICKEGVFKLLPIKGEVLNTVGAGDSMVAGFISGRYTSIEDQLALALACASSTTFSTHIGEKKMIDQLVKEAKIIKL